MPEERTTVLCPSCKNRMRIRQITQSASDDARNFVYNCAMCDIEIKQPAPHASNEYAVGQFDFFSPALNNLSGPLQANLNI
jgi:hypothetical protein